MVYVYCVSLQPILNELVSSVIVVPDLIESPHSIISEQLLFVNANYQLDNVTGCQILY